MTKREKMFKTVWDLKSIFLNNNPKYKIVGYCNEKILDEERYKSYHEWIIQSIDDNGNRIENILAVVTRNENSGIVYISNYITIKI